MGTKMSAGGAVGAVLGGRGAGRALKWEFIVFLKENIGFSRSAEFPGAPRSSQNGGLGALRSARWRVREVVGRCREGFGSSGERQGSSEGGFWSSWELISTLWGQLWVTLELIF